MAWYYYIAWAAIISQLLFMLLCHKNYRYALTMYKRQRPWQEPRVALIIPCKGIAPEFHRNIASAFNLDYENYILWFVLHDKSDPAYQQLCTLKDQLAEHSKAQNIKIFSRRTNGPGARGKSSAGQGGVGLRQPTSKNRSISAASGLT